MRSERGVGASLEEYDGRNSVMKAVPLVPSDVNPLRQQVVQRRGSGWSTWLPSVVSIITVKHGGVSGHVQFDVGNLGS